MKKPGLLTTGIVVGATALGLGGCNSAKPMDEAAKSAVINPDAKSANLMFAFEARFDRYGAVESFPTPAHTRYYTRNDGKLAVELFLFPLPELSPYSHVYNSSRNYTTSPYAYDNWPYPKEAHVTFVSDPNQAIALLQQELNFAEAAYNYVERPNAVNRQFITGVANWTVQVSPGNEGYNAPQLTVTPGPAYVSGGRGRHRYTYPVLNYPYVSYTQNAPKYFSMVEFGSDMHFVTAADLREILPQRIEGLRNVMVEIRDNPSILYTPLTQMDLAPAPARTSAVPAQPANGNAVVGNGQLPVETRRAIRDVNRNR